MHSLLSFVIVSSSLSILFPFPSFFYLFLLLPFPFIPSPNFSVSLPTLSSLFSPSFILFSSLLSSTLPFSNLFLLSLHSCFFCFSHLYLYPLSNLPSLLITLHHFLLHSLFSQLRPFLPFSVLPLFLPSFGPSPSLFFPLPSSPLLFLPFTLLPPLPISYRAVAWLSPSLSPCNSVSTSNCKRSH